MAFWDDIGNTVSSWFSPKTNTLVSDSGSNPADDFSDEKAKEYASNVANQAGTNQVGFARAAGLSPAQAALSAGQSAGQIFGQGMNDARNQQLQKYGVDVGSQTQKALQASQNQQQNNSNWMNLLGTGLSAGAALLGGKNGILSDERVKTDIKDGYGILDAVTSRVKPKSFAYKADPETQRAGVMAQDLEKTPLAYTVKETPEGKVVDAPQLTAANTAMISELSKKVDTIGKFLRAGGA